jgi:thermitase
MRQLSIGFLCVLILSLGQAQAAGEKNHPNNLFVKMKPGQSLVRSTLIKSAKRLVGDIYLVKTQNTAALAKTLNSAPTVEYVEHDTYAGPAVMPKLESFDPLSVQMKSLFDLNIAGFNDPQVGKLWAFSTGNGMDVEGAYRSLPGRTAEEVIVAVVDTGVDHTHEDLKDVMWANAEEIPGNGVDDDANGYIDDIHGINTLVRDAQGNATMNTQASHWHGTHVAGTIAATQNNGVGIAGVASNVKIMAIRTVPDNADELDSDIVEGFLYAAKHGAKVINCSFGKAQNEGGMVVRDVINEIGKKYGVLVIASAGNDSMGPFSWHNNDSSPKYPASFDSENLLVIASTTSSGGLSGFSNIGPKTVDVAAPGSNVYSTVPGNKYNMASGTSMASPNTSGVAAMILGYYPNMKATTLKKVLMDTVVKVPEYDKKIVTGGRVNLKLALEKAAKLRRR